LVHALGPRTHRHVRCGAPTSQGDAGLGDGLALFVLPELRAHAARDVSLEERKGGRREGVKVRRRRRKKERALGGLEKGGKGKGERKMGGVSQNVNHCYPHCHLGEKR